MSLFKNPPRWSTQSFRITQNKHIHERKAHTSLHSHVMHDSSAILEESGLSKQPDKTQSSWEMLSLEKALDVLDHTSDLPTLEDFICILQKCRERKNLLYARRVYMHLQNYGMEAHDAVRNCILPLFLDCGSMSDAQLHADWLIDLDVDTRTCLILGYIQHGKLKHALNIYQALHKHNITFNSHVLVVLLKACGRLKDAERGQGIHVEIVWKGFEKDIYVGSTLVDMYAKCALLLEAQQVLDKLPARNVVSWNALAAGYAQHGLGQEVLRCLVEMQLGGISPNAITLISALKACGCINAKLKGQEFHKEILQKGLDADLFVGSTLVDMYAKCGLLAEAKVVFETLAIRDIVAWTALIAGYAEHGPPEAALMCFEQMKSEKGICSDGTIFMCVLKACACIGGLDDGYRIHAEIVQKGLEYNTCLDSSLVDMYAKCGSFKDAVAIIEKLHCQNVVPWNAILAAYVDHGPAQEAQKCFEQMQLESVVPNAITYVCILKIFGSMQDIKAGYRIHGDVVQKGLDSDIYIRNALVDMYAKCSGMSEAQRVFDSLPIRNVVSWTALLAGYAEHGPSDEALNLFEQMQLGVVFPDAAVFACVLRACAKVRDVEKGGKIHREITEKGLESDFLVGNALVDMYAKCGSLAEAQKAFDKLLVRNVVSWTSLLGGYAEYGLGQEALKCFERMQQDTIVADAAIFASALKACSSIAALEKGREIHGVTILSGLERQSIVSSTAVDMYAKCGSLLEACTIFHRLQVRTVASWNVLIAGFAEHGHGQEALRYFEQMQLKDVSPDVVTFVSILKACCSLGSLTKGYDIHTKIMIRGLEQDLFIANSLVNMYAKCESLSEAHKTFDKLPVRSIVSWNALITGYAEQGPSHEALTCFEKMQAEGLCEAAVTFICGLKACGDMGALAKGQEIHKEITQRGLEKDVSISSVLIDMYAKCGALLDAHKIFDSMLEQDVVAWNAIIKGYGLNHDSEKAIKYFEGMQKQGVKPNAVTFTCLLTACGHTDQVLKGQEYFKLMQDEHRIVPRADHYACMVDLLARSGNLYEAEKFLKTLPFSPSRDAWLPLLTACKVHADAELGDKCFQKLIQIIPDCATPYILMATIYAKAGRWDDVFRVEELRKHAGAAKKPATAVVEVKDMMHEFVIGTVQSEEVMEMVDYLNSYMEEEGHVPDVDLVLDSIYNEEREAAFI